jgi:geranylgeranyl pyrophosphate synthase
MKEKDDLEESCRKILEDNGGTVAEQARTILLEDQELKNLKPPLEFISKNWRDPLTPALMGLSCESVGGRSRDTHKIALAMSLMNLSFYVWDDLVDHAKSKLFKPTLLGKFGEGTALIVGGLASAKAFSILNDFDVHNEKRTTVNQLFWQLWTKMAQAETSNLESRIKRNLTLKAKFGKIKAEAVDLETCLRVGAVIGNGSESEAKSLGQYGLCLGIILELWKDFHVSVNLTLELAEKIRNGAPPYYLLRASQRSEKTRKELANLMAEEKAERFCMKQIVEGVLETDALSDVVRIMQKYAKKGKKTLQELKKNDATQTLQAFIEAQPGLFVRSLKM